MKVPVETFTTTRGKSKVVASDSSALSSTSSKNKGPVTDANLQLLNGMLSCRLKKAFSASRKKQNKPEKDVRYIYGQEQ